MKKRIFTIVLCVLAMISFSVFAVGCNKSETPPLVAGEDTVIVSTKKTAKDLDAETAVFAALGKLESYSTYQTESSGKAVAKKGFINYTQNTTAKAYKHGDEYYSDTVSESSFVNVKHEAFGKGEGVAYRISGGDVINTKLSDYIEVYGVTPAKLLSGHVFNQETLVSASLISSKNGLYTYSLTLEKDGANALLKKQMKMFGNLGGYPAFSSDTKAKLVIKEDLTPVSYSYESNYSISVAVLGNMDCVETNEIKFDNFNGEVKIPDTEKFNAALGTTPSKIESGANSVRSEAEEKVISALLDLDMENGVSFIGNAGLNGKSLPLKLSVAAKVNEIIDGTISASEAIKGELTILNNDDIKIWLANGRAYALIKGEKFAITLPDVIPSLVKAIKDDGVGQMIKIERNATENGVYEIRLPDYLNDALYPSISASGLGTENGEKDFKLFLKLYIPRSRIGNITFKFKTDLLDFETTLNVSEERFTLTKTFENFDRELSADLSFVKLLPQVLELLDNKLVRTLLKTDFAGGLSASGNLYINDVSLPVTAGFAVDVRGLLFGETPVSEAISFKAAISDKASVIYEKGNLYLSVLGEKYLIPVENLPESGAAGSLFAGVTGGTQGADNADDAESADSGFTLPDFSEYFTLTEREDGVYDITLAPKVANKLYEALADAKLATAGKRDEVKLSLSFAIADEKFTAATVGLKTDKIATEAEFVVREEKYEITENLGEYTEKLNLGKLPSSLDTGAFVNAIFNKFTFSLLDFDLERGVSFVGTVGINDSYIPVKVQIAADLRGMIKEGVHPRDAITVRFELFQNANLSVLFYKDRLYVTAGSSKYIFNAPAGGDITEILGAVFGSGESIKKYVSCEYYRDYYIFTATSYAKRALKNLVTENTGDYPELAEKLAGIIEGASAKAYFYTPNGKLSNVSLSVEAETLNAHANFVIANEELIVEDLRSYRSKATAELNANVTLIEKYNVTANARIVLNTLEANPLKAISAEVTATLDKNLKTFIGLANVMKELELPEWFTLVGSADTVKLTLKDGRAYFYLLKGGTEATNAILALEKELPVLGSIGSGFDAGEDGSLGIDSGAIAEIIETANDIDPSLILALIPQIFTVRAEEGIVTIALTDEIVKFIQDNVWAYVPESIYNAVEPSMSLAVTMFELYKPLAGMGLEIDATSGAATLFADVYDIPAKDVFVAGSEYTLTRMLSATFTAASGENFEITTDLDTIARNAAAANAVIEKITALRDVKLTDEYLADLEAAKADYNALSEEQQKLVYNYKTKSGFTSKVTFTLLKSQYDKDKKAADKFLTDIAKPNAKIPTLAKTYDKFSDEQRAYLDRTNAEAIKNFRAKRVELETDSAATVEAEIEAIEAADVYSMTAEEIYARLEALNAVYAKYAALEKGSVKNEEKFISAVKETAAAYAKIIRGTAEGYMAEFKGMTEEYCALTVTEMNELYEKTSVFYATYYTNASKLAVYTFVQEKDEKLKSAAYNVTYYTTEIRAGFRSGAAYAANAAIDELLGGNFSDEEAASIVEEIKTFVSRTDVKAVTRYEEFTEYAKKFA